MNSQDLQIFKLNNETKCKLAASSIQGVGVFAIKDIQKGEKLYLLPPPNFMKLPPLVYNLPYASLTKLLPKVRQLLLERWPSIINGSLFKSPNDMAVLCTFVNHSFEPNYDVGTDTALKEIPDGTEVTEDYRRMNNFEKVYPWLV